VREIICTSMSHGSRHSSTCQSGKADREISMNKLKMHTPNLTEDNISRIRELFPGCVTEAQGCARNCSMSLSKARRSAIT